MTTKNNLHTIELFLNIFGLTLENQEKSTEKIPILDQKNNPVGNLTIQNNQIIINVEKQNMILHADYILPQTKQINDLENNAFMNLDYHLINFYLYNNEITINGEFQLDVTLDSQLGSNYIPRIRLTCKTNEDTKKINMNQNGKLFEYHSDTERIRISPFLGEMSHNITIGEYDIGKERFPYKLCAAVLDKGNSYQIFMREEKFQDIITYYNETIEKNAKEDLVTQGQIMKSINPKMYETIQNLRELLKFDNISLLDSLFNICYNHYTEEELMAILGITREKTKIKIKK